MAETVLYSADERPLLSRTNGRVKPAQQRSTNYQGGYGSAGYLTQGGIVNPNTGLGTSIDKSESSFFNPTRIWWRSPFEILYVQSWACANFVDIPVDDMFIQWREWDDASDDEVQRMVDAEKRHKVKLKMSKAMKAGRAMGTGSIVMVTKEAPLEEPLEIERIREGDLLALHQFDRFDMSVHERVTDLTSPDYGRAATYRIHPSRGGTLEVHASRVIRFEGIEPLTDSPLVQLRHRLGRAERRSGHHIDHAGPGAGVGDGASFAGGVGGRAFGDGIEGQHRRSWRPKRDVGRADRRDDQPAEIQLASADGGEGRRGV